VVSPGIERVQAEGGFIGLEQSPVEFTVELPESYVNDTFNLIAEIYPSSRSRILKALRDIILRPRYCFYCIATPFSYLYLDYEAATTPVITPA